MQHKDKLLEALNQYGKLIIGYSKAGAIDPNASKVLLNFLDDIQMVILNLK